MLPETSLAQHSILCKAVSGCTLTQVSVNIRITGNPCNLFVHENFTIGLGTLNAISDFDEQGCSCDTALACGMLLGFHNLTVSLGTYRSSPSSFASTE